MKCFISACLTLVIFASNAKSQLCEIDLCVVLDGGGGLSQDDWTYIIDWVKDMVSALNIGPSGTKTSVITFDGSAVQQWTFNGQENTDISAQLSAFDALIGVSRAGSTSLRDNIKSAVQCFGNGDRGSAENVVLYITDGVSSDKTRKVKKGAKVLKKIADKIIAVGVDKIDLKNLKLIATKGPGIDGYLVFVKDSFSRLNGILKTVMTAVCIDAALPTTAPPPTTPTQESSTAPVTAPMTDVPIQGDCFTCRKSYQKWRGSCTDCNMGPGPSPFWGGQWVS